MSNHDLSAQELATEVENGLHGQGHREQRQSLNVSRQKYRNIMSVIAQRKETTMTGYIPTTDDMKTAIQEILELHKENDAGDCSHCISEDGFGYVEHEIFPCLTVETINTALGTIQ